MSKHEKAVFNTLARELTTHFAVANALVDDIAVRCSSATLGGVPPPPPSVAHGGAPPPLWQVRLLPSVGVDASLDLDSVNVQVVMPPHTPTTPPTRKRHAPRHCTPSNAHLCNAFIPRLCLIASLFHFSNVQTDGITAPDPEAAAAAAAVAAAEAAAKAAAGSGIRGQGKAFETEEVLGLAYLFIHSGATLCGKHGPARLADQPGHQAADGPRVAEAQGCPAPESASVRAAWKKRIWPK